MKAIFFIVCVACFLPNSSIAQTMVDHSKANFLWNYSGPAVDEFRIKCGTQKGKYTITKAAPGGATRSYPVSQVITNAGTYYCVLAPYNKQGEAAPTDEYNFTLQMMIVTPP